VAEADVSNIDFTNKYAWGTNVGWLNFNPTLGVTVYDDHLEGYAWAENVGWIRLGTYEGGGTYSYNNSSMTDYGVNNDGSAQATFPAMLGTLRRVGSTSIQQMVGLSLIMTT
jgi:hypothetical protein